MRKQRAIIIGGSIGGLFAANLLSRAGWQVDVCERVADDLAGRGAGIGTHEELFNIMRGLGIAIDDAIGVRVPDRVCLAASGEVLHRLAWPHVMTHWVRIYRPLRERLAPGSYHARRTFVDYSEDDDEVLAHFDDGSSLRADLLIGADGLRSTVRACLFPDVQPLYAGYIGWRGIVEESALPASLRDELGNSYYFALPPGEMLVCYPVPGRYWNYVWYRPVLSEAELRDLCTDAAGRHHGPAIPPPLVRADVARKLKEVAHASLAPRIARVVEHTQPFFQAIYDLETPRIAAGRVALVGDAAFVARPHVGAGVAKAADDAGALVRALTATDDVAAALTRFETERLPVNRAIIERARHLGAYLQAEQTSEQRAHSARHSIPEAVLAETALMDFLYA